MLNLTKDGNVLKKVPAGAQFTLPSGDIVSPAYAGWKNSEYELSEAPIEPAAPPDPLADRKGMTLSFAQLMIGLVARDWISEEEGRGWLKGILPQRVEDLISTLPEAERFAATARATVPSQAYRLDPLVVLLAKSQGKTDEDLDEFFRSYAK